ncbi:uncharacterized protein FFB20_04841 [Fusarium fujikuroi]|nr:uncharacterized protein FFB20_04841 [Fusarium fujikuroi]SCN76667.1 uncharacterized protein FFE2_03593 [Fusarium fujikuroi]SCN78715.1 uncharacterized protein FFM5_01925 [Fusarium fujikuroi]SCN94923.1 uncharacterized protein FFC1_07173 [Fusarium fujikuroi]SCO33613.1 uncharacterized protein FFMR_03165 [Fusarium fujikuroi]
MDLGGSRYRSVSQASLNSAYQSHERRSTTPRLRSPSQPRLPFQSLNDTSALLRSTGPLESMLKTTTETGDLGIYSINSGLPSNTSRPPRTRVGHKRARRPARPYYDEDKYGPIRDDRRSLPSYRDTTSEIISLYGSPGVPHPRSFSPASEGQRTHSLTTCSSRRVPSFKSSGTFHSQQSNNGHQRPRSPFPYPTRLRRPGVRPSSPAVTDNGLIDHRRMVEIDRSSHRMNYSSHMHRGYRKHRRYPPLSLRPEFSRSMSSLPPRSSSAPYYGSRANPSRRPSGAGYPPSKSPYLQYMPGDHSVRSASLTSIVDMYHGRAPDDTMQPLRSPSSFYYDYTEEFDKGFPCEFEYASTISSPQGHTIGILRRDDMEETDTAPPASFKDSYGNSALPESKQTQVASVPMYGNLHASSPKRQEFYDSDINSSCKETPISIKRTQQSPMQPVCEQPATEKLEDNRPEIRDIDTKPRGEQPKESHLMTSTLAQCGSPVLSIDTSEGDWVWEGSQKEKGSGKHDTVRASPPPVLPTAEARCPDEPSLHMGNEEAVSMSPKLHGAHHRRTPANTNIKITNKNEVVLPKQDAPQDVPKANIGAGILSPNPISPAHQLRVTNSIPQLMKALPPLPDEAQYNPDLQCWSSTRHTAAQAYTMYASSPANNAIRLESKVGVDRMSSNPVSRTNDSAKLSYYPTQSNPSRFKVRLRSSKSGLQSKWSLDSPGIPERSSSNHIKPRLRLKVSRSRMSNKLMGPDVTIVRNSPLKQYSSLLELNNFPHRDAFTDRSSFREALEEQLAQFGVDKRLSNIDEGSLRGPSRQLSDQFDIPYPPSTKGIVTAELVNQPKFDSGFGIFDRWDFDKTLYSGKNFIRKNFDRTLYSKPMRNKSSFLRHRASPTNMRKRPRGPANLSDPTPLRSEITQGSSFEDSMLTPSVMLPQRIRNRTRRVKRWAAEAKKAVQALMRRTLSRSRDSGSER